MVTLLLASLLAHAGDPRIARWEPVDGPVVTLADGSVGRFVGWEDGSVIGLRCPGSARPEVVGITRGVRVAGDWVSPGAEAYTWQIVPPEAVRWSGFVVMQPECALQRRRVHATPWAWALSEQSGEVDTDRPMLVGADAASWAGLDALRRAALRPPGPHPVGFERLWGDRSQVPLAGRDWVTVTTDEALTLRGPRRLRLDVRALGEDPPETCIMLDGSLLCQPSAPSRTVMAVDGRLVYDLRQLEDGTPVHGTRSWQLAVGPGTHRLRMDRDVLVRASLHRVETYGEASPRRRDLLASDGVAAWSAARPPEWETMPAEGEGGGRWLSRAGRPGTADAFAWHPVDSLLPDAMPVESGEVALWITPESETSMCQVHLDDTRFMALAPTGVHRFEWVGPSTTPRPDIHTEGCEAWLHATGPVTPGARSLVYLQALEPGDQLHVPTDPDRAARLEVALRPGDGELSIQATSREGALVRFRLDAADEQAGRLDEDGIAYTDPVRLPLPRGSRWTVTVDGVALVRVRQPAASNEDLAEVDGAPAGAAASDEPVAWELGEHGEALFVGATPSQAQVRRVSGDLARAVDDEERAGLLVERGGLLAARGAQSLAARDLLRAEELSPDQQGLSGPVGRALRLERERALYGPDRWRAQDPAWVSLRGEDVTARDETRAQQAARGDYLSVATSMGGAPAVRWWRRALLGGQIPDAQQRLDAFLLSSSLPEHPGLNVLQVGTGWEGVNLVRGAGRRKHVPWPVHRQEDEDLLYPDAWPSERIVPLRRGWLLRLPARRTDQSVAVRCLVRSLGTTGPCRILAEDASGDIIATSLVSGWGAPGKITVPAGRVAYLRVDEPSGAHAQLLWTARGEVPGQDRLAWEARPGQPLTATVLAPTAVRAHVRPLGDKPVNVRVEVEGLVATQRVQGEGEVIVPIRSDGPATFSVTVDRASWVRLAARRAVRGGPTPTGDRRAVRGALRRDEEPAPATAALPPVSAPRPALAAGVPARTWIAELVVGSAEWTPAEARGPSGAPPAVTLSGGVQARVSHRAWLEGGGSLQSRFDGTVISTLDAGADLRLTQGRTRLFGIGDVRLAAGPFAGRTLGAAHLDVGLRLVQPVWAGGTFQARLNSAARLRTGLDPELGYPANRGRLWSRYVEEHPVSLSASGTLRHRVGPWIVARGGLRTTTNAPNDSMPIDLVGLDASVDLSRASLFTRWGAGVEQRFVDEFRKDPFTSVVFHGRAVLFPWITERVGVHPWAGARWRPTDRKASIMLGVQGRLGAPRALQDVRPSQLASRHVGEWGFWERAQERWPVSGGADGDPDWVMPGIEPVEVAP